MSERESLIRVVETAIHTECADKWLGLTPERRSTTTFHGPDMHRSTATRVVEALESRAYHVPPSPRLAAVPDQRTETIPADQYFESGTRPPTPSSSTRPVTESPSPATRGARIRTWCREWLVLTWGYFRHPQRHPQRGRRC